MTTELFESNHLSTTDSDLSPPEPDTAEAARDQVVKAWATGRRSPTSRFFSRLNLTAEETYDIDIASWRRFDLVLLGYVGLPKLRVPISTDVVEERETFMAHIADPAEKVDEDDRQRRYAELAELLDEWANEDSNFDEQVAPLIEAALRETSPRHFAD